MKDVRYIYTLEEAAEIPVGKHSVDPDGYEIIRVEGGWVYGDGSYGSDNIWTDEEMLDRWGCILITEWEGKI